MDPRSKSERELRLLAHHLRSPGRREGHLGIHACHAVELANDTRYGLTAGIATKSLRYAHEFMQRSETGLVNVNLPTAGLEFQVPFGGNKESGVGGREQGPAALDFYSAWKTVSIMPL